MKSFSDTMSLVVCEDTYDAETWRGTAEGSYFGGALLILSAEQIAFASQYPFKHVGEMANAKPFASDAFGDLFVQHTNGIARIALETGDVDENWGNLKSWGSDMQVRTDEIVGQSFLASWVAENGPLPDGFRLSPKVPFILGGQYELSNMAAVPLEEIVGFRASLAEQTAGLPDGSRILLDTTE